MDITNTTFRDFEYNAWQNHADGYSRYWRDLTSQTATSLMDATKVHHNTIVLDVASGPGDIAFAAADRGADVTGIDFSEEMVLLASGLSKDVNFRVGDAENLDFPDDSFDVATMNFGMLHISDPERAMKEIARVLRPGGWFAFTVWASPEEAQGFKLVQEAVAAHGDTVTLPEAPDRFTYADPAVAGKALLKAGFAESHSHTLALVWTLPAPEDVYNAYFNGTARTGAMLRAQIPDKQDLIAAEMAKQAQRFIVGDHIEVPMAAVVTVAHKA